MTHYNEQLREVMTRVLGGRSTRIAAAEIGCDSSLLWHMHRHGKVPRRETVIRIAEGLNLDAGLRRDLFLAAGYVDFAAEEVAA